MFHPLGLSIHFFISLGVLLAFLFFSRLLLDRRPPSSALAWVLVIIFVPYVGIPLYLMFGGRKIARMIEAKGHLYGKRSAHKLSDQGRSRHLAERILVANGVPSATVGNGVHLIETGESAYRCLIEMIENARHCINIATFILGRDAVGREVIARLAKRAGDGVEVRLLLDAFGCFWVRRSDLVDLVNAGGKVAFFMPMLHVPFRGRSNLRNHRKMVIVDHGTALVGGMNIAEEYMGPSPKEGRWRDLALRIEGPAVKAVEDIFRSDWAFAANEKFAERSEVVAENPGRAEVQVVGSGPDAAGDPLYEAFLSEIFRAERRIWVATPYFVPDDGLARAFELAARRGVDVRILVPQRSNHFLADLARGISVRQVEAAGGRIFQYRPGMIHAKATLIDEECAVVASANLDMRSLFLNYEIALFLFAKPQVQQLSTWFENLLRTSKEGTEAVSRAREVVEGAARLISPLL